MEAESAPTTNVELAVGLARIKEKVDGVIQRLDVQNGSIARLTAKQQDHESKIVAIETREALLGRFVKPAFMIVSAVLGHNIGPKVLIDLFRRWTIVISKGFHDTVSAFCFARCIVVPTS